MSEQKYQSQKMDYEQSGELEPILSEAEIRRRIKELAAQISQDYQGKCPIFVGILKGGFIFTADLIRELTIDCRIEFFHLSSYQNDMKSSGELKLKRGIKQDFSGEDIIVVEDIVDSGLSVNYLYEKIMEMEPKSLRFVSLLVKDSGVESNHIIDYVGFNIPRKFVVGYGLDYAQKLRNLKHIYVIKE